jgi:hypothetical protein
MAVRRTITGLAEFRANVRKMNKDIKVTVKDTMTDCMNDLARVSSETAPLEYGNLEKAWTVLVKQPNKFETEGFVGYSCWADQPRSYEFDYAIWIHEMDYNLGPLSKEKQDSTGAGHGLSGKIYPVQKKYLTRPFEGEAETYRGIFEQNIKETIERV